MKKIECKDIIKLFMVMSFDNFGVDNDTVKILWASCRGMYWVKIKNTSPILNALPVITIIVLIPAATPLLNGGTEFIMVALLGEANIPIPAPIKINGNANS